MTNRAVALVGLSALLALSGSAAAEPVRLFDDDPAAAVEALSEGWVKRSRIVTIDRGALFGGAAERDASPSDRLSIELFADARVEAVRRDRDLGLGSTPAWYGEIDGEDGGYAFVVMNGEAFWGKVYSPRLGTFEIAYVAPGTASVREVDLGVLPGCGVDHAHEDVNVPGREMHDAAPVTDERGGESGTFIFADVGMVYTTAMRVGLGGTAQTEAFLDAAIADSNIAYGNSQINLRIRSAFKHETGYTQHATDMGTDLGLIQSSGDGNMDEVHGLRNTFGADLVTLFVNTSTNACGIGYLMTGVGPGFEDLAFNVVARSCVSGLTFPHELGHNMGCAHDRDNAGGASHSFAYGYRTPNNAWRTVMSYAPGTRVAYFSNPNVMWQGFAMGVPAGQSNSADNSQAINLNANTIAAWRTLFTQPPGSFALQTPADTAVTSDRTPDFTWEAAEQTDYYKLEVDNDPGFGSPEILEEPLTTNAYSPDASPPLALQPGVTYYWRVTAVNPLGSQGSSPISRSFTTPTLAPAAFTLITPAESATNVSRNPSFQWSLSNDTDGYTLTVDDDAGFGSPAINSAGILGGSFTWFGTPLEPLTTYYWKVTSSNSIGTTPSTPGVRTFGTIGIVPESFNLTSPADGVNVTTLTPTLSWAPSNFADSYRVIVDDNQGLTSPTVDQAGLLGTSYAVPAGRLVNGIRYYWQVQATNITGTTNSSPAVATFGVIVPSCQGDANGDLQINFIDISTVLANWGLSGPAGDANHDGAVNFIDISTVLANWGGGC